MAYAPKQLLDEDKKQEQIVGGSPVAGGSTTPVATTAAPAPKSTSSGRFTNLQEYIGANRPQATQLAGQVAGKIESKIGEAKSAIESNRTDLQNRIRQGYSADPNLIQSIIADPTRATSTEAQNLIAGRYTGPEAFTYTDITDAGGKIAAAKELANTAKTEGGQIDLQAQLNPALTSGAKRFNQLLLNTEGAQSRIGQAGQAEGLNQNVDDLIAQGNAAVETGRQAAADAQRQLKGQIVGTTGDLANLGNLAPRPLEPERVIQVGTSGQVVNPFDKQQGAIGQLQQTLMDRVSQERSKAAQTAVPTQQAINALFVPPKPRTAAEIKAKVPARTWAAATPEQPAALGINQQQFTTLQGLAKQAAALGVPALVNNNAMAIDLVERPDQAAINLASVATPEEASRYLALARIAGVENPWGGIDPAQAGTYRPGTSRFKYQDAVNKLTTQINQKKAANAAAAAAAQKAAAQQAAAAAAQQAINQYNWFGGNTGNNG